MTDPLCVVGLTLNIKMSFVEIPAEKQKYTKYKENNPAFKLTFSKEVLRKIRL